MAAGEHWPLDDTFNEATLSIQAVLFDADGVIQRPSPMRREAWQSLLGPGRNVDDFFSAVLQAERPAWVGASDFIAAFSDLLVEWRCRGTLADALVAWTMIEPDVAMLDVVAALRRRGVRCHLATNQEPHRATFMSELLGYHTRFDQEFYSCRLGAAKPATCYFEMILAQLELSPKSVLFLDDKQANVDSARSVGINAEQFIVDAGPSQLGPLLEAFGLPVV